MKNRKGFTLVELLAVIAILAILVIIAMPNVLKLFNEAKMDSFLTEAKALYKEATTKYITETMNGNRISSISSEGENKLDITGNNIDYCFTLDNKGNVTSMKVGKGGYYIESDGNNINELRTSNIKEGEIDVSSCIVDKSNDEPVDIAGLTLNFNGRFVYFEHADFTFSILNSSSSQLTNVIYKIYDGSNIVKTYDQTNKNENFLGTFEGEYDKLYTLKAYDQNGNFMFEESEIVNYCFVAGTKVKTENGYKNIEDIKIGDKVYSYNLDNNEVSLKSVLRTFVSSTNDTYIMTINNKTFEVTPRHQLYIIDKGWVRAYEVKVGDKMLSLNKEVIEISSIVSKHYDKAIKTYNFHVDGNSNYFVSDVQVLVHNASPVF